MVQKSSGRFIDFSQIIIFIVTVAICHFALKYIGEVQDEKPHSIEENVEVIDENETAETNLSISTKPKYCFMHATNDEAIFESADFVLKSLGLEQASINWTTEILHYDWDLLWVYDHQNTLKANWSQVKFNQKVNHIFGSYHLTSKSVFGSTTMSKYVPRAFLTVADVKKYVAVHPEKRFVVKRKSNRGVILQKVEEMNFTNSWAMSDFFAMEFVEDPLLFNGHKFDFAVYVVITSVNPLRIYYYNKNIIMRFCPKKYNTSDPEDRDSYVVKSSHIPGSKFPGIKEYLDGGYTYKEGFNSFLNSFGSKTEEKVWSEVENLIRSVILSKEKKFIEEVRLCCV